MITGGVVFHDGRLYVPVSSLEEGTAAIPTSYECCTFRGSVVSLDAATGKQVWKTYTIPRAPEPAGTNSVGTQLRAPSGAAVWSAPALEPERNRLYITTGDSYSAPGSAGERFDHGARDGYGSRALDPPDAPERRMEHGVPRHDAGGEDQLSYAEWARPRLRKFACAGDDTERATGAAGGSEVGSAFRHQPGHRRCAVEDAGRRRRRARRHRMGILRRFRRRVRVALERVRKETGPGRRSRCDQRRGRKPRAGQRRPRPTRARAGKAATPRSRPRCRRFLARCSQAASTVTSGRTTAAAARCCST